MTTNLTNDPAITLAGGAQPLQDQANLAPATAAPSIEIPSIQELSPDQCLTSLRENSSVGRYLLRDRKFSRDDNSRKQKKRKAKSAVEHSQRCETVMIANAASLNQTAERNHLADVVAALDF